MSTQAEATSVLVTGHEVAGGGSRCDYHRGENRERRNSQASLHQTATAGLFVLSAPRQLVPAAGVIVYCQVPAGTPLSTQVRVLIVPVQALPMVWTTPVVAL
jgi:hypothetical protein